MKWSYVQTASNGIIIQYINKRKLTKATGPLKQSNDRCKYNLKTNKGKVNKSRWVKKELQNDKSTDSVLYWCFAEELKMWTWSPVVMKVSPFPKSYSSVTFKRHVTHILKQNIKSRFLIVLYIVFITMEFNLQCSTLKNVTYTGFI